MAGLLVSVRSVAEASAALEGGATLIDIKEPARGPLGAADPDVWQAVRRIVPADVPVSVALGELVEWLDQPRTGSAGAAQHGGLSTALVWPRRSVACPGCGVVQAPGHATLSADHAYAAHGKSAISALAPELFAGITYRKMALAGAMDQLWDHWPLALDELRRSLGPGPAWVLVAYADWHSAHAPDPDAVLDAAIAAGCAGVLVDTWQKGVASSLGPQWRPWIARARQHGLMVALAGGLDREAIARLAPLEPDWFAVRGAACRDGDRNHLIDSQRVAELARIIHTQGASSLSVPSRLTRISSHSLASPSDTQSRGAASGFTAR